MGFSKLALTLAILSTICLSTSHLAHSQSFPNQCLRAHNAARRRVHVPPLTWSQSLAKIAQRYVRQHAGNCRPIPPPPPPYGWNVYIGRLGTCSAAVASWVSEKPYYNCPSNTCAAGRTCTHYTQVVWSKSKQLGCGRARCTNGNYIIACAYNPKGNIPGERPYWPCIPKEELEAVEGAVEELVEETLEEAVEETLTEEVVPEEEEEVADVPEENNVIAEVV